MAEHEIQANFQVEAGAQTVGGSNIEDRVLNAMARALRGCRQHRDAEMNEARRILYAVQALDAELTLIKQEKAAEAAKPAPMPAPAETSAQPVVEVEPDPPAETPPAAPSNAPTEPVVEPEPVVETPEFPAPSVSSEATKVE